MRRPGLLLLLAVAAALAAGAGCSGGGTAESTQAATAPFATPGPGETLRAFVEAAGNGDAAGMWALLSAPSRERLGPTEDDFVREYADGFARGLGSFAGTGYQVVLSNEMPSGFGVAAIAGNRARDGEEEFAAYGAAARREGDAWRLELGAEIELAMLRPPARTAELEPPVAVSIVAEGVVEEAGLWLDGVPLPGTPSGSGGDVEIVAKPTAPLAPGNHLVVIFGRSGDLVIAGASPFAVVADDGQGATTANPSI